MKSIEKIWAELSKQSTQEVELLRNPIDEIVSVQKKMNNHILDAFTKSKAVIDDVKRIYNILVDVKQVADDLEGKAENAIEAFVEMGGRPPQEVIRGLDAAQNAQKGVLSGIKTAKTAMKNIENITRKF